MFHFVVLPISFARVTLASRRPVLADSTYAQNGSVCGKKLHRHETEFDKDAEYFSKYKITKAETKECFALL